MGTYYTTSFASRLASVTVLLLLVLQKQVFSKPVSNSDTKSKNWMINNILTAALREVNSNVTPAHAFIKLDTLNGRTSIPSGASLVVQGDSSLRLFKETDINHPSFDPTKFLKLATNDSVQAVEVQPVSDQPYFMFVSPALLKNQTLTAALFGSVKKRRIKRHHPGMLQSVLGELQNYALVPIKSANGQIRYILLKNPKFVIGNPATNGQNQNSQTAPTIIQLNSNNLAAGLPGGKVRYTPKIPVESVTTPTLRMPMMNAIPAPTPMPTPTGSIFNTRNMATDQAKMTSFETKKSVTSSQSIGLRPMPNIPRRWKELRDLNRNIGAEKQISNPVIHNKKVTSRKETKSVMADKVESSASSLKQDKNGIKASIANATIVTNEANVTNVDQSKTKNITITKVGDHHKIEQTEIFETVVDVKNNGSASKTDIAASKVLSNETGHGSAGNEGTDSVSANSGASEKATAEKQAKVVKKTKKTTTILLKSASETKSGKAEISEIQHTVEEEVHHNTSETAAAETAATANVGVASADAHSSHNHAHGHPHEHSHGPHGSHSSHSQHEKSNEAEAKKATNSTSTSVKTKSVKQTVIKKSEPDGNSTSLSGAVPGTAEKSTGGFDVQHVEHVVQETEHKTVDTSQKSKEKASSSSGSEQHHTANSHSHSHGHAHGHEHGHTHDLHSTVDNSNSKSAENAANKEMNSSTTSVKTKSVKQTVIKTKIPDTNMNNSTSLSGTLSDKTIGGVDVQHVEHVVQETEHKTVGTSQKSNEKASASSGSEQHHHASNSHPYSHEPHPHVHSGESGSNEANKEVNSHLTSVKTKSVKQTVINKKIPDTNINNSGPLSNNISGTAGKSTSGVEVQHVEHMVHETEHKTVDTSQKSNEKGSTSSGGEHHTHASKSQPYLPQYSHDPHPHVHSGESASNEANKEVNSHLTSVKTKSVKQTVINKKIPDTNINNSGPLSNTLSGTAGKSTSGVEVQHVEHMVHETEHKTVDTSQKSNEKGSTSSGGEHHTHASKSQPYLPQYSHDPHPHVHSGESASNEANQEVNSHSTSVKTKSVKQTVIDKKIPDTKVNNSGPLSKTLFNTVDKATGGVDVQHLEHIVQETEHRIVDTSQKANQKASTSSGNEIHHH